MIRKPVLAFVLTAAVLAACSRESGSRAGASTSSSTSAATSAGSNALGVGSSAQSSSSAAAAAGSNEEQQVRAVFVEYKAAIRQSKGEAAANAVSERTLAYFERMRSAALHMPASAVKQAPVMDRTVILISRARVSRKDLERWRGRELFVHAVNQGWVGKEAQRLEPDAVALEGDTASLGLRTSSEVVPPAEGFRLYREAGGWKLDVLSVARPESAAMRAVEKELAQVDPDPNRALEKVIASLVGKPVGPEIWQPLVPKP
jgi:hypothetical protein